jgi:hypothetical protein
MKTFVLAVLVAACCGAGFVQSQSQSQAPAKPAPQPAAKQAPPASPSGPIPPPAFDDNVANVEWGGRVESITDFAPNDGRIRNLISEASSGIRTEGMQGTKDVVLSFFKRDPVLIGSVHVIGSTFTQSVKEVEIWTSPTSADTGWAKAAEGSLPPPPSAFKKPEHTFTFPPVEARFVKVRLLRNHHPNAKNQGDIRITRIRVLEAKAPGYVPLLTRHPEIAAPAFVAEGLSIAAAKAAPVTEGCAPSAVPPLQPGTGESRKVLLVLSNYNGARGSWIPTRMEMNRYPAAYAASKPEFAIYKRIESTIVQSNHLQPWMLPDYDTVVMQQVCDMKPLSPRMRQALVAWIATGRKLILHDADKCKDIPDYSWLPQRFKSDNPGALGEKGSTLRILENTWMMHNLRGKEGFVDGGAWVALDPPANELGDSNAIIEWDSGWCGQLGVKNAHGVFGFAQAYARHGRGLIIWDGLDVDMVGTTWLDLVHARQLAQGFNTDNLPCGVKVGSFAITTEPRLLHRGVKPGERYTYPLSVLSNLGYKGTVTLSAAPSPAAPGFAATFEPATVEIAGEQTTELTITVPPGTAKPMAVEVKGTAADGKTQSLCLQLGPPKAGELAVVSALAPPAKTRKNLEIILDASGSMKTLMGAKKTRWDVALETLQGVLADLPDDFKVGLRIYGHREPSTSPKTCTDTELLVPIVKLDRARIFAAASRFKPKGETPLVFSALQAPADLKQAGGGTVILITDGEESCKGDPVKAAAELKASGLDIRLSIVGFAVTNPKTQQDLAGFAQGTGGLFYSAKDGAALSDALLAATTEKFPFTVYNPAGKAVLTSEAGSGSDELPPGDYKVVVKAGAREIVAPRVKVTLGLSTTVRLVMKNGQLVLE